MKYIISIIILLCFLTASFGQNDATCGFTNKKVITILGSQITGGPHTDFPILIDHIDGVNLTTAAGNVTNASGFDIVFVDDEGNFLDFQLESYNGTTGQIVAWVKIPTLTSGTDVDIHMLYGKATIVTDQSTTDTWDVNFAGVWHMSEDPSGSAPQIIDHTAGTNNGTSNGSMTSADLVPGFCGSGIDFDGSNDFIDLGDVIIDGTSTLTVEAWINPASIRSNGSPSGHNSNEGAIVHKNGSTDDNLGVTISTGGTAFYVDDGGNNTLRGAAPTVSVWTHVAVTWDGLTMTVYQNGSSDVTLGSVNGTFVNNGNSLRIGGGHIAGGSPHEFNGIIDEVRISNIARNPNWIATSRASQNNPEGTFYTISAHMSTVYTSSQNGDWDLTSTWGGGGIPDVGANVTIDHQVDIDIDSEDYTICSCTLVNVGGNTSQLNLLNARTLTIIEDVLLLSTGDAEIELNLDDNGTTLNVLGNLTMQNNSSIASRDVELDLDEASILNLTGNLIMTATSGEFVEVDLSETADVNIGGDIIMDQDGGVDLLFLIDTDATVDVDGDVTIDQDGGDDVVIEINDNVNGSAAFRIAGNLSIDHDGGDDIDFVVDDAGSLLQVGGNLLVDWDSSDDDDLLFNLNGGNFTVIGTSTLSRRNNSHAIFFDLDGGDFNANTGMIFNSSGALGTDGAFIIDVDNNSIFTCTGNMTTTMTGGDDFRIAVNNSGGTVGEFNCTGNLTVLRTAGDDIDFIAVANNSLINIGGNLSITTTGGEEILFDLDNDATINVGGSMSITATEGQDGLIFLRNTGFPSFDIGGDFNLTIAGGNDDYEIDLRAGEITVGQDMVLSESTGVNEIFLDMDGGDLTITRDFFGNLSGAGTSGELLIDVDNGTTMTVGRNMELDISGGNDLELHLEQNATSGTARLNVLGNLTLDHNGATGGDDIQFIINNDAIATVGGDFTMDTDGSGSAGNFYTRLNNNSLLDVNGNVVMNSSASSRLELELNNSGKLELAGNFVRQASPNNFGILDMNGSSTLEYDGNSSQIFAEDDGGGADSFDYENVIINNGFGADPQITMEGLATVGGSITFTDGVIASTATNLLVLEDDSDALSESDASFVDGPIKKIGNDAFDFPVGDDGQLQQISITAPGSVADEFTAQYFEEDPGPTFNPNSLDPSLDHVSSCEYWTLDRTVGTSNVQVNLNYDPNSCGVTDLTSLVVARWDGTTWRDELGTVSGNLTSGTVETPGTINSFIASNPFTLASTNSANPLPIELISFDAIASQTKQLVNLFWSTATEINNDFFTVQRSKNGFDWEDVIKVDGAGNSATILNYDERDLKPYKGLSYYRLSQTDFDGTTTYSKIVPVNLLIEGNAGINVYPNPAFENSAINIALQEIEDDYVEVEIVDIAGKELLVKKVELTENKKLIRLSLNRAIPSGTYIITVRSKSSLFREKLMVK